MPRDLLEIVEDYQTLTAPGDGVPELVHRVVLSERHVEPLRNRVKDAVQASGLRKIAEPDAAREISERVPPEAGDQPRLAGAADAQNRDEARPGVQASCQLG